MQSTQMTTVSATPRTAFVLGNGPSLKDVDLFALSDYATVGLNAAYRYWYTIDWRPTYYACLDEVVGLSHKDAIADLITEGRIELFLLRGNLIAELGDIAHNRSVLNFDALRSRQPMLSPPTITTGSHSALWMGTLGFEQIVLLGIDGNYQELVKGAEAREGIELEIVEGSAGNPNYFFEDYQRPGDRYNVPNPRPGLHVEAWHAGALELERAGVAVFNANPKSDVGVFPYIDFNSFMADGSQTRPAREAARRLPKPGAAAHAEAAGPTRTASKLSRFLGQKMGQIIGIGALIFLGMSLAGYLVGWALPALLLVCGLGGGLFLMAMGLLYTRFAVAEHLGQLQLMQDSLTQRLIDLERPGDPPHTPSP